MGVGDESSPVSVYAVRGLHHMHTTAHAALAIMVRLLYNCIRRYDDSTPLLFLLLCCSARCRQKGDLHHDRLRSRPKLLRSQLVLKTMCALVFSFRVSW